MTSEPEPPLLTPHTKLVSGEIDRLHDAVEPLAVGHELHAIDPATCLDGAVNGLVLGEVGLVWVRYGGAGVIVDTPPTGGDLALCAPQAPMGVEYRASRERATASGSVVISQDQPMRMRPHPVRGCLVMTTKVGRLREHLGDLLGYIPSQPLQFQSGEPVTAAPIVERTWRYVCGLLDDLGATGVPPMVARSLEQSLLSAMLLGLPHSATAELATTEIPRADRHLADRIRDWLEAYYRLPIGVADLATAMGVTIRHIHAVCQQELGLTPMHLLRTIRLDHARAELTTDPTREIATIAREAGFAHMGRFAATYRKRFGETPSETRRRTSAPAAADPAVPATHTIRPAVTATGRP